MRCYDASGRPVELGQQIGRGGEGSVFVVEGGGGLVAKIYHRPPDAEKSAKIAAMARLRTARLARLAAWPTGVLYEQPGGAVIGFLMPEVIGYREIHLLYSPKDRIANFPTARWPFLIQTAANVARAFAAVHAHDCVIGDVNHGNVVVSSEATVRLIDCDSFQIAADGHHFLCDVGVSTHTPPELQGKPFRGIVRTPDHDAFGLAVLIFQLLFMGRHPFSGRYAGSGEMPLERAIREYRFAYGTHAAAASRQMRQPPGTLTLEAVSPPVAALFERAFRQSDARPVPREWVAALTGLSQSLQRCPVNGAHDYLRTLDACPWCEIERRSRIRLFRSVTGSAPWPSSGHPADIEALWASINAIEPPAWPDVPTRRYVLPASAEYVRLGRKRRLKMWGGSGGIALGGVGSLCLAAAGIGGGWVCGTIGLLITGVYAAVTGAKQFEEAQQEANTRLAQAKRRHRDLCTHWQEENTPAQFGRMKRKLAGKRKEYNGLAEERARRLRELHTGQETRQMENYLDRFRLADAPIAGLTAAHRVTLASYGVETAADATANRVERVPGLQLSISRAVVEWRLQLEQSFVFNPTQKVDPSDVDAIENDIATRRAFLLQELEQGPAALRHIRDQTTAQCDALRPLILQAQQRIAQAEADLDALYISV